MARGRFLSTTIRDDKRLNSVSLEAEYLFLKAIPHLDRDGLISADTLWADVMPRRKELQRHIDDLIAELAAVALVVPYECDEGKVLFFPGFTKNQSMAHYNREAPSRFSPPPESGSGGVNQNPDEVRTNSGKNPDEVLLAGAEVKVEVQYEVKAVADVLSTAREPKAPAAAIDSTFGAFIKAYEKCWGLLPNGTEQDRIAEWSAKIPLPAWEYALQETREGAGVGRWKYLDRVLNRVQTEGIGEKPTRAALSSYNGQVAPDAAASYTREKVDASIKRTNEYLARFDPLRGTVSNGH